MRKRGCRPWRRQRSQHDSVKCTLLFYKLFVFLTMNASHPFPSCDAVVAVPLLSRNQEARAEKYAIANRKPVTHYAIQERPDSENRKTSSSSMTLPTRPGHYLQLYSVEHFQRHHRDP